MCVSNPNKMTVIVIGAMVHFITTAALVGTSISVGGMQSAGRALLAQGEEYESSRARTALASANERAETLTAALLECQTKL